MRHTNATLLSLIYNSQVMRADFSKLKDALQRAGINQSELARQIGVERAAVSKWITGRATPTLEHLLKAAKVLGMSLSEILGEEVLLAETSEERNILQGIRKLKKEDMETVERMISLLAQDSDK